jgi:nucleoside-diphosphate kinase
MTERTLVLIKPEGVYRAIVGKVVTTFEDAGLKVVGLKMVQPDNDMAGKHYIADEEWFKSIGKKMKASYAEKGKKITLSEIDIGKKVRNQLLTHLTSGPVTAMVVEGNAAIDVVRKLVGSTEPRRADPASIRGRFASDTYETADVKARSIKNIVHASDSVETSKREIALWFGSKEIVKYKRVDEDLIY